MGAGISAGRYQRLVRTVDIAPTLATLLGIAPTEAIDGRALGEVLVGRVSEQSKALGGRPEPHP